MLSTRDKLWLDEILALGEHPTGALPAFAWSLRGFGFREAYPEGWTPAAAWMTFLDEMSPPERLWARHVVAARVAGLIYHWVDGGGEPLPRDSVVRATLELAHSLAVPLLLGGALSHAWENRQRVFPLGWLGLTHEDALRWALTTNQGDGRHAETWADLRRRGFVELAESGEAGCRVDPQAERDLREFIVMIEHREWSAPTRVSWLRAVTKLLSTSTSALVADSTRRKLYEKLVQEEVDPRVLKLAA